MTEMPTDTDTSKDPGGATPSFGRPESALEAVQTLARDLDATARAIEQDEFSDNGAGALGTAFRSLRASKAHDHEEAWSALIELAGKLWEAGYLPQAHDLIDLARIRLTVPDVFGSRVDTALSAARNAMWIEKAEKRFSEGDMEAALGLLQNLPTDLREEIASDMRRRQTARRRNRRLTFGLGVVSTAALLVMLGVGISSTRHMFQNPPRMSLPEFPHNDSLAAIFDEAAGAIPPETGLPPAAAAEPQISPPARPDDMVPSAAEVSGSPASRPDSPANAERTPDAPLAGNRSPEPAERAAPRPEGDVGTATDLESIFEAEPGDTIDDAPPLPGAGRPSSPESPSRAIDAAPSPRPDSTLSDETDATTPAPEPRPLAESEIRACALGQRALARAMQILDIEDPRKGTGSMTAFFGKLAAACARARLSDPAFRDLLDAIPDDEVETIAQSLVSGE